MVRFSRRTMKVTSAAGKSVPGLCCGVEASHAGLEAEFLDLRSSLWETVVAVISLSVNTPTQ
jgi:hypothetical protein